MRAPAVLVAVLLTTGCSGVAAIAGVGSFLTDTLGNTTGPVNIEIDAKSYAGKSPPTDVLRVLWRRLITDPGNQVCTGGGCLVEFKPQEFASAASDGTRVFIGSKGGRFYALRPRDGVELWKQQIDGGVSAQPLYLPDLRVVFVGGSDGAMHAFDAQTGESRWVYRTKGPIGGHPVFDDGTLYFTNGENRVFALDARSGAWKWQYDREAPDGFTIRGFASPLAFGGRVYAGFSDGFLVALNGKTGDAIWARSLAGDATRFIDVDSTPALVDGTLFAASYAGGVYALDPADGAIRWHFEVEGAGSVRVDRGRVYFAASKQGLHCLDTGGHVIWRQSLSSQGELSAPVLIDPRYVLVSASEGGTYVVDRDRGQLLQFFKPGHGVTAEPATDGRFVYLLTNTGFFYTFALR